MPQKSSPIFVNEDTRTWVQPDGPGTEFVLYSCQALTEWRREYDEPVYVKCKSPDEYNKLKTMRTVHGKPQEPTFSVAAFTPQDEDFLIDLECPVDWQVFYGMCESPSSPTGYTKIRHFYRASKRNEGESNVDYIGDEESAGIQQASEFTAEDVVTILKVAAASAATGVTETQPLNDIAFLAEGRCEGDCGPEIKDCEWGAAVADNAYPSHGQVWKTENSGDMWYISLTDPFAETDAAISAVVVLPGEVAPRIIVFQGTVSAAYAARCSITDDWGDTWTEVDMGGLVNGSYINSVFAYSSGLIYAVGNDGSIWYSVDRGGSWTWITDVVTGANLVELRDIHTPDGDTVYVVGDANTLLKSEDGCESFETLNGPADGVEDLLTVQAPTTYRVLVGGERDAGEDCLWLSTDGGETFNDVDFTGSTDVGGRVNRLRVAPRAPTQHMVMLHGTGANDRFYRTLDGGATWERMAYVANSGLNGLFVCTINLAWACGNVHAGNAVIQKMSA